jgi:hypothetical protein
MLSSWDLDCSVSDYTILQKSLEGVRRIPVAMILAVPGHRLCFVKPIPPSSGAGYVSAISNPLSRLSGPVSCPEGGRVVLILNELKRTHV